MEFSSVNPGPQKQIRLSGQITFADNQKFSQIMELAGERKRHAVRRAGFRRRQFHRLRRARHASAFAQTSARPIISPFSIRSAKGQVEKIFLISRFDQLFSLPGIAHGFCLTAADRPAVWPSHLPACATGRASDAHSAFLFPDAAKCIIRYTAAQALRNLPRNRRVAASRSFSRTSACHLCRFLRIAYHHQRSTAAMSRISWPPA